VIGVDVAEALLRLAAAKATAAGLRNVQLVCADAGSADQDDGSFDAVVCVFGIFFAADPAAFAATLWRCVRPGGTLAITTWGPDLFEPGNSILWDEIGRVRPDLYKSFNPWDSLVTTDALSALLRAAGAPDPEVEAVPGVQPLADPDGFWDIALGSGYRATIDALDAADAGQVRGHVIRELSKREVTEVTTNVVFGLARKPPA
jgi:SAM-dependent methyltransferase